MRRLFQRRPKRSSSDNARQSDSTPPAESSGKQHFPSGLKLLFDTEDCVVDIIFVHGLTGDREKTWKTKNAAAPWPQTLLPAKVPNARVLTFGYDAYVIDWRGMVSKNKIGEHSMNLLSAIATYREEDDTSNRSIIFVCHSLGGLVCQDALVTSLQRPESHLRNIFNSIRGFLFLGTPHRGSGLARSAEVLAKYIGLIKPTNPSIIEVLKHDSEVVARVQDSFLAIIRSRNEEGIHPITITCFFEELPLPGLSLIVTKDSATLPGYPSIGIHSDHRQMARFDQEDDPGFIAVAGELRRWSKDLCSIKVGQSAVNTALHEQRSRKVIVPYTSNSEFVGRSKILSKLKTVIGPSHHNGGRTSQARVALHGLGGIGKTQTALAYVYWVHDTFPEVSIFWVHAGNRERFCQAYLHIAESYHIPGYDDPKLDTSFLVKNWLESKERRPWLMIIDNADNTEIFFSSSNIDSQDAAGASIHDDPDTPGGSLAHYIPECSHGSILITTRNKQTGVRLTRGRNVIEVGQMDPEESSQLICKRLEGEDLEDEQVALLTARLENLPLALAQAAAFIQESSLTLAKYIQMLEQSDSGFVELLSQPFEEVGRDSSVPNPVAATWIVSFEQIKQQCPLAIDILSLMSFFDRQGIPKLFLSYRGKQSADQEIHQLDNQQKELIELESALGVLKAFSFIQEDRVEDSLTMHRLIQLVMRKWLMTIGKFRELGSKALSTLSDLYPFGIYENWPLCGNYLPHVSAILSFGGWSATTDIAAEVSLLYNAAKYMQLQGKLNKAEELLVSAVENISKLKGIEHLDTLNCMSALASTYSDQGRFKEAEELEVQVLEIRKRVLGIEHPATLIIMGNLASTYRDQGRLKEAEELVVQVLETRKRVLGIEHLDTLTSIGGLAFIYKSIGRLKEAVELEIQVLEIRKRVLGIEHPDTLISMGNLASIYSDQGRLKEAEALELKVLETRKRVLGTEHPDTLTSMNNLGLTYANQGRLKEAEELEVQVLEIGKRVLGIEHPHTLTGMNNLGLTYANQGRLKEAEELEAKVLETRKRVQGTEHPDTLTSMNNLASTFRSQGRLKEVEELELQILETRKRVIGIDHPDTITSMNNLASTYRSQGRLKEAEELSIQVLETRKRVLGTEHPTTLTSMNNLASTYWDQSRLKEAEELELQVLETSKRVLGIEHPDTIRAMRNLAFTWEKQGHHSKALDSMEECIKLYEQVLGMDYPEAKSAIEFFQDWKAANLERGGS